MKFQENFQGVSKNISCWMALIAASREVTLMFMKVKRKIEGCFEGVLRVFQGSFNGVEEVLRKFQGRFREVT